MDDDDEALLSVADGSAAVVVVVVVDDEAVATGEAIVAAALVEEVGVSSGVALSGNCNQVMKSLINVFIFTRFTFRGNLRILAAVNLDKNKEYNFSISCKSQ